MKPLYTESDKAPARRENRVWLHETIVWYPWSVCYIIDSIPYGGTLSMVTHVCVYGSEKMAGHVAFMLCALKHFICESLVTAQKSSLTGQSRVEYLYGICPT